MKIDYEKILNEEQYRALIDTDGPILVSAGAGSGKTRVLTHKIAYLIQEKNVDPYNILAITFTNKAAKEMQERVMNLVEDGERVWISTFHSMCAKILRYDINLLDGYNSNFTIYSEDDTDKLLKQIFAELEIVDEKQIKEIKFHISNCKGKNQDIYEYAKQNDFLKNIDDIIKVFDKYDEYLKQNNALDFDDLLSKTVLLFKTFPGLLEKYSARFKYILVDEFQDTNQIQFDLVKMLASINGNIFVVGDENQCIYSWRGANYKNIIDFKNTYKDAKIYKLEQNYRSTKAILNLANNLIKNNTEHFDKVLWTEKEEGVKVEYRSVYNEREEAEVIANTILKLREYGYNYNDFAILLRLNALTLPFEEKMLEYNIPHKIYGGFKFFERAEIKIVLAYLRLFVNKKDNISLEKVINFPKRGVGESTVEKIREIALNTQKSMLECIIEENENNIVFKKLVEFKKVYNALEKDFVNLSLSEFVQRVVEDFGIKFAYQAKKEDFERAMNIDALISSIKEYEDKNPNASLENYLETVCLINDIDSYDESGNFVTIATIHSVKGLEFKNVFIVGAEETIFPISRAFNNVKDMEEERRLMYVAITRAEERLFISSCKIRYLYGKNNYMMPSRFLNECGITKPPVRSFESIDDENTFNSYSTNRVNSEIEKPSFSKYNSIRTASKEEKIQSPKIDTSAYQIGQLVLHPKFGIGTINNIDSTCKFADINFKEFGNKTLLLEIAPLKIIKGK